MITINISSEKKTYDINFFQKFSSLKTDLINQIGKRNHIYVTDENVFEKTDFFDDIDSANICVLPAGEQHKTWESVTKILDACFAKTMDRSSVLIAVGGGVVGDMTGFAASIFMRGVPCIQIPTTLLSMVDSSVGGKTGIDTKHGKNLIGAFNQPERVFCCKQFLQTLEFVEIQNGLCEMIKHGILGSEKHFANIESLANKNQKDFSQNINSTTIQTEVFALVDQSINIKKNIVEQDEKEQGVRGFLNLGHTYGHAIELLSNFTIPHGIGVAKGIWCAVQESEKRNFFTSQAEKTKIQNLFSQLNISLTHNFSQEEIEKAMIHDKKKKNGNIRLILIENIGKVRYANL